MVRLTEPAVEDLERLAKKNPEALRWALKKVFLLERDPEAGEPLHRDLQGWRKLVVSDRHWRVVWRVDIDDSGEVVVDVADIWAVGARGDSEVYAEMKARVNSLPTTPTTEAIKNVLDRLGRSNVDFSAEPGAGETALPDWLVSDLVEVAGIPREMVERFSLQEAMSAWGEFRAGPKQGRATSRPAACRSTPAAGFKRVHYGG